MEQIKSKFNSPEERRKFLAESFTRAAQTFEEALKSEQEMVDLMRAEGKLLEVPKKK